MALSSVSYVGDGSNKIFAVTFPYLSKTYVKVYVDGVEDTTFTWLTASSIQLSAVPVISALVEVIRVTSTTPLVDFVDGSTLTEALLDEAILQTLHVGEESRDAVANSIALDGTRTYFDADSKNISNLATPLVGTDAATKAYVDSGLTSFVNECVVQATAAGVSAVAASASADTATTQASLATASYDSFDDRYLGAKAVAPTLDNDGNALLTGAMYWNTVTNDVHVWTGAVWQVTYNPGSTSGVTDGDKGDVIVTSSGAVWTLDTDAVTTIKIADANVTSAKLADTTVTPGSYTYASLTVDAKGRLTAASSGATLAGFPSGTRMPFNQTAAPTGWTKDTTAALNDSILRIVTGTVGAGGSAAFSTWNAANPSVGATTLTTSQIPSHTHTESGSPVSQGYNYTSQSNALNNNAGSTVTGATGGGGSHTHTGGGAPVIKYNDFIIASKD